MENKTNNPVADTIEQIITTAYCMGWDNGRVLKGEKKKEETLNIAMANILKGLRTHPVAVEERLFAFDSLKKLFPKSNAELNKEAFENTIGKQLKTIEMNEKEMEEYLKPLVDGLLKFIDELNGNKTNSDFRSGINDGAYAIGKTLLEKFKIPIKVLASEMNMLKGTFNNKLSDKHPTQFTDKERIQLIEVLREMGNDIDKATDIDFNDALKTIVTNIKLNETFPLPNDFLAVSNVKIIDDKMNVSEVQQQALFSREILEPLYEKFTDGYQGKLSASSFYLFLLSQNQPTVENKMINKILEFRSVIEKRRNDAEGIRKSYASLNDPIVDNRGQMKVATYDEVIELINHFFN